MKTCQVTEIADLNVLLNKKKKQEKKPMRKEREEQHKQIQRKIRLHVKHILVPDHKQIQKGTSEDRTHNLRYK